MNRQNDMTPTDEDKKKAEEIAYACYPNDRQAEYLIHQFAQALSTARQGGYDAGYENGYKDGLFTGQNLTPNR